MPWFQGIWNQSHQGLVEPRGFISLVTSLDSKGHQNPLPTLETGRAFLRRGMGEFTLGGTVPLLKIAIKIHYLFASKSQSLLLLLKLGKAQSFHPFSLISPFSEKIWGKSSLHLFSPLIWFSALFSMRRWKNILKIEKKRKYKSATTELPSHLELFQSFFLCNLLLVFSQVYKNVYNIDTPKVHIMQMYSLKTYTVDTCVSITQFKK